MSTPMVFSHWRKSSHSKDDAECVEVGRGTPSGGVAADGPVVGVRDTTQNGLGPILEFSRAEWGRFLTSVKDGRP